MGKDIRADDFRREVIEASRQQVVVVDFWAEWCAPCRMLGPILEKVVAEFGERAKLVKLNVDEAPQLAAQYGIRGIPAVKMFRDGAVAGEFVGLLPENEVRLKLKEVVPSEADDAVALGRQLLEEQRPAEARRQFERALELEPANGSARLGLAEVLIAEEDIEGARKVLEGVAQSAPEREEAERLLARLDLAGVEDVDGEDLERKVRENPNDPEAWYQLGCWYAAREEYPKALESLLKSVEVDRGWHDAAAREKMVEIFRVIGMRSPLADEYRDRLQNVLY